MWPACPRRATFRLGPLLINVAVGISRATPPLAMDLAMPTVPSAKLTVALPKKQGIPPLGRPLGSEQLINMDSRLGLHHPSAGKPKRFARRPHYRKRWVMA